MIYLFDKDERLIKLVKKDAIKTAFQKFALTTEKYVSDRLTVEMKALSKQEFDAVEYMAIQSIEDAHTFHYFYIAQKFSGNLTTLIGVQSGIEELRKSVVLDKRPHNTFARPIINELLAGTNWQARFVSETSQRSTNFYYISTFEALKKVCQVWNLEMQFFVEVNGNKIGARYIDFKQKIGEATGKRVVYGHNALQILQEVERTNLFTALIGRGKGEEISAPTDENNTGSYGRRITFEDVVWEVKKGNPVDKPKGQKYVELPEMTKRYGIKNADGSMRAKVGFAVFEDEEDKNALIKRTYDELVSASRPQLTLKTSTVYLKGVKIGDTIRVVRHDKKLDYDTRIFEITFNRLNNESSDIKLGDRISESNEAKIQNIASQKVDELVSSGFNNIISKLPEFLPSADGFNNNWYGKDDPTKKYVGKVLVNDIWFKPDPEHEGQTILLRWTGEVWQEIIRSNSKQEIIDEIERQFGNLDNSALEEVKRRTDEAFKKAGASEDLAKEAKRIGLDSVAKLDEFKRQATSAQTALSGDLDVLKRTVTNDVNQASEYRRTTTEALSRMTGQMNGFATKSEVKQDIDGLTQTFAKMRVGGTNLLKGSKGPFMPDIKPANFDNYILYVESTSIYMERGQEYIISAKTDGNFTNNHDWSKESDNVVLWIMGKKSRPYQIVSDLNTGTTGTKIVWNKPTGIYHLRVNTYHKEATKSVWDVKIEKGNVATDWSPAIEDVESQITEARTEFKQTADGLSTKMATVETYVGQDNQRQETLQRYAREESAKQATAVRELVTRDYVGKSTFQESVQGVERRLESLSLGTSGNLLKNSNDGFYNQHDKRYRLVETLQANQVYTLVSKYWHGENSTNHTFYDGVGKWQRLSYNKAIDAWMVQFTPTQEIPAGTEIILSAVPNEAKGNMSWATLVRGAIPLIHWQPAKGDVEEGVTQKLAEYTETIDGRFATISSQVNSKVNQSDFQRVKETSQLYERILGGSGSSDQTVKDNVARLVMTNQLFQTEVGKYSGNGVNRAVNTTLDWGPFISRSGNDGVNLHADLHKILSNGFKAGDTAHVRMEISIDSVQRFNDKQIVAILQSYGDVTNWARAGRTFDYNIGNLQPGNNWRLIEFDTVMTGEMLKNNSWMLNIRVDGASSYKVHTKSVKVEKGNVASAWSPAPEDTEEAVRSVQSQLAGSWAVQNINSAGDLISGINLGADGRNRLIGKTFHITGETLIDNAVIKDGMIANLNANKITGGTIDASEVNIINVNASNILAGTLTGMEIRGGQIDSINGNMHINLQTNQFIFNGRAGIEFKSPGNSLEFNSGGRKAFLAPTVSQGTNYAAFAFGVNDRGDHDPNRDFVGLKIFNQPDARQVVIIGDLILTSYASQGIKTTSLKDLFELINDNFKRLREYRVQNGEGSPGFWDVALY
jgi:phage minor structural protein